MILATTQANDSSHRSSQDTAEKEKLPESVLLIEDDEEAMWLVRDALKGYGNEKYDLEWARDLKEGLDYLSKNEVALVLLDLGLPDSTGPSSYESIRATAPNVPVLVLTGDTRVETEFAVTSGGTLDYLVKDEITAALLVQAINGGLYQNKLERQSDSRHKASRASG
jgi:DNA-binding response OmpR family regulator